MTQWSTDYKFILIAIICTNQSFSHKIHLIVFYIFSFLYISAKNAIFDIFIFYFRLFLVHIIIQITFTNSERRLNCFWFL